ncbi:MAG TPA: hypothetical protein VLF87_02040 [Patescibacteria group bacterium]|nr:hypothetical protein [Patescibacteria group bacterium]
MHHWQDSVLAISFVVFSLALLPSVLHADKKPALATSSLTFTFLIPGLVVYVSLRLWYSAVLTAVNASLWGTLAVQRYLLDRKK